MRSKKILLNTIIALLDEFVSIICGFILPKLILETFGSSYNGLATSVTQFLRCAVLLRAGIGGATRAALYKPLAENDKDRVSRIMKATNSFMHRIACILAALIIAAACIFPFVVRDEFDWFFTFSLVLIIGISAFAESYFGISYQILLQADQKTYVYSVIKIGAVIFNTCAAIVLIRMNCSLHMVQFGNALAYAAIPVIINMYVRRKYRLDKNAEPDMTAIKQRWDAFAQQAAAFVTNNSSVLILTAFAPIAEVSVFTVYNMVNTAMNRTLMSITSGIEAAFGNIIAKGEKENLERDFSIVEFAVFMTSNILYTCAMFLVFDFIRMYTKGITDIEYIRPGFGYLLLLGSFLNSVRLPYQLVVQAAGHYKQTKAGAIAESVINIAVSLALVVRMGLTGVAVGFTCATLFRTIQYATYASRVILRRSIWKVLKCMAVSALFIVVGLEGMSRLIPRQSIGVASFLLHGLAAVAFSCLAAIVFSLLFYRKVLKDGMRVAARIVRRQTAKG